ncbi:prepilin-type N-terminal cleavage/methylation domain-containing protein [Candidatus Peregrinibacteria bacterium]|nr:prepilin-type N-terminal cleavage/methylation domain-containing protein [Candidatus Peregrinibacteria bacterium]
MIISPKTKGSGFTLVELVVAVALFAILVGGVAALITGSHLSALENSKRLKAGAMLTETWEALRTIRNGDFTAITEGAHGLRLSNGYWEFYGSSDERDGITRQVTVSSVRRDGEGNIVEISGEPDPDSKKILIEIGWSPYAEQSQSVSVNTYLHNYPDPAPWPPPPESP